MLRDVLLRETPPCGDRSYTPYRRCSASVVVGAHAGGSLSPVFAILGACLCFATRMIGVRYHIDAPTAPIERRRRPSTD
jgi:uncharacterized membrane protein YeiH